MSREEGGMESALTSLCSELETWCASNRRPLASADELLQAEYMVEPRDTAACAFLEDFIERWTRAAAEGR